mgnify:CR=1 FL=1
MVVAPGLAVLMSAAAVSVVHEHVHQWTGQHEEVRQNTEQVGSMLGDQVEPANRRGDQQRQPSGRAPEGRRLEMLMVHDRLPVFHLPAGVRAASRSIIICIIISIMSMRLSIISGLMDLSPSLASGVFI